MPDWRPLLHALSAAELHKRVPPNWYEESIRVNPFQRFWHTTRFREISKLIEPSGGKILDIGCADGVFTKVLLDRSNASSIIGIDVREETVAWARGFWSKEPRLSFQVADGHALPFPSHTFDAVTSLETLEHVYHPEQVLSEAWRVLKPGGYALFLVPTDSLLFRVVWYLWKKVRGGIWEGTHVQSFRNGALGKLAERSGFKIEKEHLFLCGMLYAVKVRKSI